MHVVLLKYIINYMVVELWSMNASEAGYMPIMCFIYTWDDSYSCKMQLKSFNSSSNSSRDWLWSSFPARCWPTDFRASFIHNIPRKEENMIGWRRSSSTTLSTTTTTHHHHYPPTLTEQEVGREKWGGSTSETQSLSHSRSFVKPMLCHCAIVAVLDSKLI